MNIHSMQGSMEPPWAVELRAISKRYGSASNPRWALQNINFTIPPGIFGLLGRNGAGKTTLLNILATLLEPTSGQISVGPFDLKRERLAVRSLIGFLPQEQGFYMNLTVNETLDYMAALQNLPNRKHEAARVLEAVNLSDRMKSRVGALSGGMRRRLGLALALLGNPKLLIVDEPTTGLDVVEQQRFRTLLGTLGAQQEQIILLSTHIVSDIATIAGSVAVLEQGQLIFQGTTRELANRAQGQSWLWRTSIEIVEAARHNPNLTITSITPIADGSGRANEVVARVEGICPDPNAIACEPTLEDGYFSLIGGTENAGSANADLIAKRYAARGY
jgi:ABC-2 type transport system ATP-binding protein